MPFIRLQFHAFFMNEIDIRKNVSLKDFCTFHIGGNAKFLCVVQNNIQLIDVCKYCSLHHIKYKIIGLGANLLFDDRGYDGMIVVNKSNNIHFHENIILADGGVNISSLIMKCCVRSLSGLEHLVGIPATVGGSVVNSLGAFGVQFCDFIELIECYHKDDLNTKIILKNQDCHFGYRTSIFKSDNYIITRVKLNLYKDKEISIKQRIQETIQKKSFSQPLDKPTAGSVFKRGNIIPAKVIDELGLKGTKIGGAEISIKHSGFIINSYSATSNDVKDLISLIQEKVQTKYNEILEPEIEFVEY